MLPTPSEKGILDARASRSFLAFAKRVRPKYVQQWYQILLAEKLQELQSGKIKRLIITMPPGHAKSEYCSRLFPAWCLGVNPSEKIITASYGADLAQKMNRDLQAIMTEEAYQSIFPKTKLENSNIRIMGDGRALRNADEFEVVTHRGGNVCAGVGGALTGRRGSLLLLDDPFKNMDDADSNTISEKTWTWFGTVFMTRIISEASRVLIATTRWNQKDIVGRLKDLELENPENKWEVIDLPALMTEEHLLKRHPRDPRINGEALWPDVFTVPLLGELRRTQGVRNFEAVYQQNPTMAEGTIVQRGEFKYWNENTLPEKFEYVRIYVDCSFKEAETSDYVAIGAWGKFGNNFYLLDVVRRKMGYTATCKAIKDMKARFPNVSKIMVELAANGFAVVETLDKELSGVVGQAAIGSKASRLHACSGFFEAGNVRVPEEGLRSWVGEYINEIVGFPAKNDDQVDMTTMALIDMNGKAVGSFSSDMQNLSNSIQFDDETGGF